MLTTEIAEMIVKETSARLNRNVNIMSNKGIIIASCDSSRLYHMHEGALEVLRTEQPFTIPINHKGKWKGAQSGINLPIVFDHKIVGVIGITGDPEEMRDFGGLVKMTTELLIKQAYMATQAEWQQRTKEMIIENLLKEVPAMEHIERRLSLLHICLAPPFYTVVIQLEDRSLSDTMILQQLEKAAGASSCLIGFVNTNRLCIVLSGMEDEMIQKKVEAIDQVLKFLRLTFRLAYSTLFMDLKMFNQSYEDCSLALEISDVHQEVVSFAELEAKALIYQTETAAGTRLIKRVLHRSLRPLIETLQVFFEHHLNMQKTADHLHIHRNTLIYRLNKIKEETGYDPRNFKDALTLQMAIWILEKKEKGAD
ncbi:helix-turn-helix domain-containing protein [Fictibacillus sp. KIGAM418]|uniref:Helix-turn-helix domain-containing protein n=1 Tax=Fictibacillus marinisediminis TaxID=2878389 RepID=A0A9X1XFF8_9BACL|nr:sugar diacid recognition domain-containing protein [Fictibacillus marinisediminis]MCK6258890.1 helix-turn-helix domain-containing protein [Fictibacillus marinisediminis]